MNKLKDTWIWSNRNRVGTSLYLRTTRWMSMNDTTSHRSRSSWNLLGENNRGKKRIEEQLFRNVTIKFCTQRSALKRKNTKANRDTILIWDNLTSVHWPVKSKSVELTRIQAISTNTGLKAKLLESRDPMFRLRNIVELQGGNPFEW